MARQLTERETAGLQLIHRRPAGVGDIAMGLQVSGWRARRIVKVLRRADLIEATELPDGTTVWRTAP